MTNSYEPPVREASTADDSADNEPAISFDDPSRGFWYLLLLPASLLYTLAAREFVGPGYTTGPNQSAMFYFLIAAMAWAMLAIAVVGLIRFAFKIRGILASTIGLICWVLSCIVPFWIGMK